MYNLIFVDSEGKMKKSESYTDIQSMTNLINNIPDPMEAMIIEKIGDLVFVSSLEDSFDKKVGYKWTLNSGVAGTKESFYILYAFLGKLEFVLASIDEVIWKLNLIGLKGDDSFILMIDKNEHLIEVDPFVYFTCKKTTTYNYKHYDGK